MLKCDAQVLLQAQSLFSNLVVATAVLTQKNEQRKNKQKNGNFFQFFQWHYFLMQLKQKLDTHFLSELERTAATASS